MLKTKKLSILNYEIISTIFVFIVGVLLHFVYEWSHESVLVGIFSPVNESVWEHLKLIFFPMFVISLVGKFYFKREYPNYLSNKIKGIMLAMMFIVVFYYSYTGIIGKDIAILDIGSFFIAVLIGQAYAYKKRNIKCFKWIYLVLPFLIGLFIIFTFWPPHIGLFKDPINGSYGIRKEK